jgi:thermitase
MWSKILSVLVILVISTAFISNVPAVVHGLFTAATVEPTWNISAVNADQFWSVMNYTGENITIAIIDSGVNYSLPDLQYNYLGGYDFVNNDNDPMDDYYHGTACASIAVGQGVYAYKGVAPNASYYALKVLDNKGFGNATWTAAAISWAVDHGANVISMSLGGPVYSPQEELACQYAYSKNVTIVASVGNDANVFPSYPAGFGSVIAVGAYPEAEEYGPDPILVVTLLPLEATKRYLPCTWTAQSSISV